jgi:hypothetical protein
VFVVGWEEEYEHWRDKGRTWGPGIDGAEEPTVEEIARRQAQLDEYRQKLSAYSVKPRKEYADAGKALREDPAPSSVDGGALLAWQKKYNDSALELCKSAAKSLGYSLELGWPKDLREQTKKKETFSVSIEYYGLLPNRGGNIHKFFVSGIEDIEDCLQLVADFGALGQRSTTWYGERFHFYTKDSGELRMELIRRFGFEEPKSVSLDETIELAKDHSEKTDTGVVGKDDIVKE